MDFPKEKTQWPGAVPLSSMLGGVTRANHPNEEDMHFYAPFLLNITLFEVNTWILAWYFK
jgi:hypothetical protein